MTKQTLDNKKFTKKEITDAFPFLLYDAYELGWEELYKVKQ